MNGCGVLGVGLRIMIRKDEISVKFVCYILWHRARHNGVHVVQRAVTVTDRLCSLDTDMGVRGSTLDCLCICRQRSVFWIYPEALTNLQLCPRLRPQTIAAESVQPVPCVLVDSIRGLIYTTVPSASCRTSTTSCE